MTTTSPGRPRGAYEGRILRILRAEGPTSRTGISAITGLSPTTITKTVVPMIEAGLLTERAETAAGLGRPAVSLIPLPNAVTVAGVQVGVGKVRLGLSDAAGAVRAVRSYSFDPALPVEQVMDGIAEAVRTMIADDQGSPCIAVGVGAPGPVDPSHRRNLLAINLGWRDVPVSDLLESRLGIPVVVDHNVQSFAVGEAQYVDHDAESLAYVYVRTGVGFGVSVRGAPYSSPGRGGESYLGHLRVAENGRLCSCGARGCLETVVAEPYLGPQLEALRGKRERQPEMMRELEELAEAGVPGARELADDIVEELAAAIATIVNLFTPELVLLGGTLSTIPSTMLQRLDTATRDRIFPLLRAALRIETADGHDASLIRGAAAIALEKLHYT